MKASLKMRGGGGITVRITLLSWMVSMLTLGIFVLILTPQQNRFFLESLESKANSVAVSLHGVAAGAAINEDFASVVSASETIVNGDPDLEFLVVTKNDGFTLIIEKNRWRIEPDIDAFWLPIKRDSSGRIETVPIMTQKVFHYAQPFDYSGIQWGWIHVGLSLQGYDRSVKTLLRNTIFLALACIFISLILSLIYAEHLVGPILDLHDIVQKIAAGNLSVRATAFRKDELGSLAESVNTMTEALLRRDRILESVRFAAQQFMQTARWEEAISPVLKTIGEAADVSRAYIFMNRRDEAQCECCSLEYEWCAPGIKIMLNYPEFQAIPYSNPSLSSWRKLFEQKDIVTGLVSDMSQAVRDILEPLNIRSHIIIPIFIEGTLGGFLGLNDCLQDRMWTDGERDSMRAAADMLGTTIARQNAQEALILAKEGADQASHAKSEFLANMSHELRTPLNHIIGFTDLILTRSFGDLTAKQEDFLKDVLGSSHHLLSLINDVLDISKVEAGKMELEISQVNIKTLMKASLAMFKEKSLKNDIQLLLDLEEIPEIIEFDKRKIKQVIFNLLSNAVKFTSQGGIVHLGARIGSISDIHKQLPTSSGNERTLLVWVSDTGIGLEEQDLTRIFNPFEQVEGSSSRKYSGTGLGLAISRKMVELHGGRIWVESSGLGKGSTFYFSIPLKESLNAGV